VAAITFAYRSWLKRQAEIIKDAGPQSIKAIRALEGSYGLTLHDLPPDKQVELALAFIRARIARNVIVAVTLVIVAIILAIVALVWRPGIPVPPDISNKLVGKYQVHLGPNGGCKGKTEKGAPNTYPSTLAEIKLDGSDLTAVNECGEQSKGVRISADGKKLFWWNESAELVFTGTDEVSIDGESGNSWQKVSR